MGVSPRPSWWRSITKWSLTLHIYVSMAGFLLLFLFAVTGITLNHGDFGMSQPTVRHRTLELPAALVAKPDQRTLSRHLQQQLGISTPATSYREYPEEIEVLFAAPGARAQVLISRETRMAQVETESRGVLGVIGDLHKGRESGRVWFWVIDFTAGLFVFSSITGMVTLASLRVRRATGFLLGLFGVLATLVLYLLWVPR